MSSTATAHKKHSSKSRSHFRDARIALSEPAHVIAARARKRYEQADKKTRIPSKKPRIVRAQQRQDKLVIWSVRIFALGIVVSLFAVVGIQTTIAKRQIEIDAIRNQQSAEITEFEKLRNDVAELKSPERITRRAETLGLIQPQRFVSISIPMEVSPRSDQQNDELWVKVKAIINATS
jgi:cell division protein FtsL